MTQYKGDLNEELLNQLEEKKKAEKKEDLNNYIISICYGLIVGLICLLIFNFLEYSWRSACAAIVAIMCSNYIYLHYRLRKIERGFK